MSTRQAQQLGRLGGKIGATGREGDREWGRRAQRQRAAKAQKQHYPELAKSGRTRRPELATALNRTEARTLAEALIKHAEALEQAARRTNAPGGAT